jgi:hypothetical protein
MIILQICKIGKAVFWRQKNGSRDRLSSLLRTNLHLPPQKRAPVTRASGTLSFSKPATMTDLLEAIQNAKDQSTKLGAYIKLRDMIKEEDFAGAGSSLYQVADNLRKVCAVLRVSAADVVERARSVHDAVCTLIWCALAVLSLLLCSS